MSVRMRHTRGHTGNRRSHHALKSSAVVKDEKGVAQRLPHRLDETTGMYRGKQIAPAREARVSKEPKAKGVSSEPKEKHTHEHAHEAHQNAEMKAHAPESVNVGGRPKARSGFGGGA